MSTTPKYSTQEILGYLASRQRTFRIRIANDGIFRPKYRWKQGDLDIDDIVGIVTVLFDRPNLVLSRIHTLWMPPLASWGSKTFTIGTTLILHKGDDREIADLPIPGFKLVPQNIECVFEKE